MEKIVAGVDGTESSTGALRYAVKEAEAQGGTVYAVHAWMVPVLPAEPGIGPPPIDYPGFVEEVREAAQELVARVVDEVVAGTGTSVRIEQVVAEGPAESVLLDAAKGADLLVVGTHGRGGLAKFLLGSVSDDISEHAPCPVVVYRGESDD
jgi:nucleotide-binding universal stress UspA family protein